MLSAWVVIVIATVVVIVIVIVIALCNDDMHVSLLCTDTCWLHTNTCMPPVHLPDTLITK